MKMIAALGAVLSLGFVSAAAGPQDFETYFGTPVDANQTTLANFNKAYNHCETEAAQPGRSWPDAEPYSYSIAFRGCLSRFNYIDRGVHSYLPITLGLDHVLDR